MSNKFAKRAQNAGKRKTEEFDNMVKGDKTPESTSASIPPEETKQPPRQVASNPEQTDKSRRAYEDDISISIRAPKDVRAKIKRYAADHDIKIRDMIIAWADMLDKTDKPISEWADILNSN